MTAETNDGGSAFPYQRSGLMGQAIGYPGMSIRDYIAVHTLEAELRAATLEDRTDMTYGNDNEGGVPIGEGEARWNAAEQKTAKDLARMCYVVADAMIEARGR